MTRSEAASPGRAADQPALGPDDPASAEPGGGVPGPGLVWLDETLPAGADLRARVIADRKLLFAVEASGPQKGSSRGRQSASGASFRAFVRRLTLTMDTIDEALAALPEDVSQEEWDATEDRARAEARKRHAGLESAEPTAGSPIFPELGEAADDLEPSLADFLQQLGPPVPQTPEQRRQEIRERVAARKSADARR